MKSVYSTGSQMDAQMLCVLLRQNGIEPTLENEFSSLMVAMSPTVPLIISVADEDADGAVHVIRKHLARLEKPK